MANLRANNLTGTGGRNAIDGSVFFGGTGDYLSIDDSTDLELGSGDFTIEGWFYFGNTGSSGTAFWGKWNSPNRSYTFAYVKSTGTYTFGYSTDGSAEVLLTSAALSADINTWVHFAAVRNGSSLKVYRNGISIIDASVGSATFYNATTDLYIGRLQSNTNYDFKGYISNFRICKGHAVYTANFTPPTQKSGLHNESVLLCCQDSDNALQEATGKTITGYGRYEYLSGTNLVTNGSGNSVSGWTDANTSTFASTGGRIQVTRSGGSGNCSYQALTTIIGQQYTIRANIEKGSGSYGDIRVYTDSGLGTWLVYIRSDASTSGLRETTFTATTTTTHITFVIDSDGDTAYYSNISVIAANRGKAPKVLPPYGIDEGVVVDGYTKMNSQGVMYFPTGDTAQRGRGRGIICGGYTGPSPTYNQTIEYITIQSHGNAKDFGDLSSTAKGAGSTLGNETRAVAGGGYGSPVNLNSMEYFEIATQSNTTDFGDLTNNIRNLTSLANSTRGIFAGGTYSPGTPGTHFDTIQYITIASLGDATDFGNMVDGRRDSAALSSPTRGIIAGGNPGSGPQVTDEIDYITIATAGDATDFGNMTNSEREIGGAASSTRGIIFGGYSSPAFRNTIDYITIATTGNASDFGDLTVARTGPDGCSNRTRAAMCGGSSPTYVNLIDFVTLATTGNAADFGDMVGGRIMNSGCTSDSHGGLS